ncbi:ATP-binding cassette domain-containing protein [Paenibacillus xylaniclasticus]|uniref:ATP-binding cassette domain-containing protein n=1 Tax=Paenibacillus xylaniclasticus TaxID=588083 RepID=UPI0013E052B6|nr:MULTISPECIES: ABC transporter ATP-binding protein [Paenibacillus]
MSIIRWVRLLLDQSYLLLLGVVLVLLISPIINWMNFNQTKTFFDLVTKGPYERVILVAVSLFVLTVAGGIVSQLQRVIMEILTMKINNKLEQYILDLTKQFTTITLIESPAYINDLKVLRQSVMKTSSIVSSMISMANQLVLIVLYFWLVVHYSWVAVFIIAIFAIPHYLYNRQLTTREDRFYQNNSQLDIEKSESYGLLTHPLVQKELLVFMARGFLMSKWMNASMNYLTNRIKMIKRDAWLNTVKEFISPIGFLIIQIIFIRQVVLKEITIGDYVAITAVVASLEGSFKSFAISLNMFKTYDLFVNHFKVFEEKYLHQSASTIEGERFYLNSLEYIEAKNLCFCYPQSNTPVICNVDITITRGQFVVFVGENGSGKSTLAKILFGLHDIEKGQLYFNGIDNINIDRCSLYENLSIIQQDFMRYPFKMNENIAMRSEDTLDKERINELIEHYPMLFTEVILKNLDQILGHMFHNSKQFSGGQWQRVAIARALYKESSFLLLDEATSELDPETEMDFIEAIQHESSNRTVLLVTHNLKLAAKADVIYVLHEGKIIEKGRHNKLISAKGKYFKMWSSQNKEGLTLALQK